GVTHKDQANGEGAKPIQTANARTVRRAHLRSSIYRLVQVRNQRKQAVAPETVRLAVQVDTVCSEVLAEIAGGVGQPGAHVQVRGAELGGEIAEPRVEHDDVV